MNSVGSSRGASERDRSRGRERAHGHAVDRQGGRDRDSRHAASHQHAQPPQPPSKMGVCGHLAPPRGREDVQRRQQLLNGSGGRGRDPSPSPPNKRMRHDGQLQSQPQPQPMVRARPGQDMPMPPPPMQAPGRPMGRYGPSMPGRVQGRVPSPHLQRGLGNTSSSGGLAQQPDARGRTDTRNHPRDLSMGARASGSCPAAIARAAATVPARQGQGPATGSSGQQGKVREQVASQGDKAGGAGAAMGGGQERGRGGEGPGKVPPVSPVPAAAAVAAAGILDEWATRLHKCTCIGHLMALLRPAGSAAAAGQHKEAGRSGANIPFRADVGAAAVGAVVPSAAAEVGVVNGVAGGGVAVGRGPQVMLLSPSRMCALLLHAAALASSGAL